MRSPISTVRKTFYIPVVVLMTMAMGACYEDEGNYDYHELDEVVIDTVGANIQPQYAIMRFDTLRLQPNVFFNGKRVTNGEDAPLDYLWTIYSLVECGSRQGVVIEGREETGHMADVIDGCIVEERSEEHTSELQSLY